jgi:hypothetical protein
VQSAVSNFVTKKKCITQLIQHSDSHSVLFNQFCRDVENNVARNTAASIKNLRSALHRMESHLTPLARAVIYWHAYLLTVIRIALDRKGRQEGNTATDFLVYIDEFKLILIAMLTEAAVQGMDLIRFWDVRNLDPSKIVGVLAGFVASITVLFVEGRCTQLGYTAHMINLLKEPVVIPAKAMPKGFGPKTIGGINLDDIVRRCLSHLQCWVSLAIHVIDTEFPDAEVIQSFAVFKLRPNSNSIDSDGHGSVDEDSRQRHMQRLAQVCEVMIEDFHAQFWDVQPLAQHTFANTPGISTLAAWKEALAIKVRNGYSAGVHRLGSLLECLMLFAAFHSCTTSNTERAVGCSNQLRWPQRNNQTLAVENDEMAITCLSGEYDDDAIIKNAQLLYPIKFGMRRAGCMDRADRGSKRPLRSGTLKSWQRVQKARLRDMIESSSASVGKTHPDLKQHAKDLGIAAWNDDLQAEADLQHARQRQKQLDHILECTALPDETTPLLLQDAIAFEQRGMKTACAHLRAHDRRQQQMAKATYQSFDGVRIFLTGAVAGGCSLQGSGATNVKKILHANIVVVSNPSAPSTKCLLSALLSGQRLATQKYVNSNGTSGASILYHAVLASPRSLWMSPAFIAAHAQAFKLISAALLLPHAKWTLLDTRAAFVEKTLGYVSGPARKQRPLQCIALVSSHEKSSQDPC